MSYFKYIIFIFSLTSVAISAQIDTTNKISVIARANQKEIIIRWAPSSTISWQMANKYGYIIERTAMTVNNKLIKDRKVKMLTPSPIKPFSEKEWEKIVKDDKGNIDKNAAIAVQAIYGGSFTVTSDNSDNVIKAIKKAEENERRFTFALFAADQSLKVARAMGLLYVDKEVNEGEKYFYRIYANIPKEILKMDSAYLFIGPSKDTLLPRPLDLSADVHGNLVTLSWNRELLEQIYSNYIVERSDNGKDFYNLDDLPFINTSPENKNNPRLMYRVDSLLDNSIPYFYRIKGRTIFEEFGPWSDTISIQAEVISKFRPIIRAAEVIENKKVKLNWDFSTEGIKNIEYFSIYRSASSNGQYNTIKENINPDILTYIDEKPLPVNYYMIRAFDKNGNSGNSFPILAQLVDSFPPSKPDMPKAKIDTTGNVTLNWNKGKEEDILGYRIFRSNFRNSEFGQITSSPLKANTFTEQIGLENLTKEIYYRIAAVDFNFNQSELSDMVFLVKPDIIPPVPPLIISAKSTLKGVSIEWINSPSKDVVSYELLRKESGKESWEKSLRFSAKDNRNSAIDSLIPSGVLFEYILVAIDSTGNRSINSKSVFAKKINSGIRRKIEKIKAEKDNIKKHIILSWEYPDKDIEHFIIYRGTDENPISFYKISKKDFSSFTDNQVQINSIYKYKVKIVFIDGSESELSKEIIINY